MQVLHAPPQRPPARVVFLCSKYLSILLRFDENEVSDVYIENLNFCFGDFLFFSWCWGMVIVPHSSRKHEGHRYPHGQFVGLDKK